MIGPARPSAGAAIRTVTANPALRRIEIAWMVGMAGDAAFTVALLVAAFGFGGPVAVGVLTVVRMAPSIVGAPLAGLLAGRRPPTRLLFVAHLVRAGGAVVATTGIAAGTPLVVLGGAVVAASAGAFVRPLQGAAMPTMARSPDELVAANVVSGSGEGVGSFGGPLIAGILLGLAGPVAAAAAATGGFLAAAAVLARRTTTADDDAEHEAERRGRAAGRLTVGAIATELTAGLRSLGRHHGAATIMTDLAGQVFVRGLLTSLLVVTAIHLVGLGEPGVGLLAAANGLGTLIGAVVAVRLAGSRALGPTFAVSLSFWGLPIAVIAAVPHPAVAIVALVVSGVANGVLDVAGFTLLQRCVPRAERMAVFGLLEAIVALGLAAGAAVAPLLIDAFGDRAALAIAGAILPILAVGSWARLRRVDEEAVIPDRQLRLLRGVPLFAPLPLTALERLAEALVPVRHPSGATILRQGDPGRDYFLIESGEVDISVDGRPIVRSGPGDGFGEIALVQDVPRTAGVVARTDVALEVLSSADFLAAVAGPTSAAAAAAVIDERLARSAVV